MPQSYFIAACVFTERYPELGRVIREYIRSRDLPITRCCVPGYKLRSFTEKMPEGPLRDEWAALPDCADFAPGDTVYSLCHNCAAVIEETKPGVRIRSLWELILEDADFPFPDYHGRPMTAQDCWRARDRAEEQAAVRALMRRMNIEIVELEERGERTEFCGNSLYRPAPPRNLKLAPKRFVEGAKGKFQPHSEAEQEAIMRAYAERFAVREVAAYCHYCVEGLKLGGLRAHHLAALLFRPETM